MSLRVELISERAKPQAKALLTKPPSQTSYFLRLRPFSPPAQTAAAYSEQETSLKLQADAANLRTLSPMR